MQILAYRYLQLRLDIYRQIIHIHGNMISLHEKILPKELQVSSRACLLKLAVLVVVSCFTSFYYRLVVTH